MTLETQRMFMPRKILPVECFVLKRALAINSQALKSKTYSLLYGESCFPFLWCKLAFHDQSMKNILFYHYKEHPLKESNQVLLEGIISIVMIYAGRKPIRYDNTVTCNENTQMVAYHCYSLHSGNVNTCTSSGLEFTKKNFAFPSEKLAKNLLVQTNFNFSDF